MDQCIMHEKIERAVAPIPQMADDLATIRTALMGTLEKPGGRLKQIDDHEKTIGRISKIAWSALGVFVVAVAGFFWAVLINQIEVVVK